jgi:glycerol-3-phosphate O-acyltransferase
MGEITDPTLSSRSHPAIRFQKLPVVRGRLWDLEEIRRQLLADVVAKTQKEFANAPLDLLLGETVYLERQRLKRARASVFTRGRLKGDKSVLSGIQSGLLRSAAEVDRKQLLERLISHYAEEIGGHFDPKVYRFAIRTVPWGFDWLLNAASVSRFLPWGMTESLQTRMHILGEVSHLKSLAQKGTILLVPTHQSNIDSLIVGYVVYLMALPPFSYGAGLNLFSNPVLSFFMSNLGAYTVDRQKSNPIYKSTLKNYSTRILREGIHSIFFPGGGRSRSGALESRVKLGLLGTGLEAQLEAMRDGKPQPNVFVVPMVTSYHFVLEASTLIEDYLAEAGKHRFIISDDEFWQPTKVLRFFWKLFSTEAGVTVRIGRPLDIFGNFVDEEGRSIGPNGTVIDPQRWLTTRGELRHDPQRDHEYTRELGERLVDRFYRENTVLTSHLVAFACFETLRRKYPELDLYRFLRLSLPQRTLPESEFLEAAEALRSKLIEMERRGELFLSSELRAPDTRAWVADGLKQLGMMHDHAVVRSGDGATWTEDMNLLYYYRNRLAGYGLSLLAERGAATRKPGHHDSKGFLA